MNIKATIGAFSFVVASLASSQVFAASAFSELWNQVKSGRTVTAQVVAAKLGTGRQHISYIFKAPVKIRDNAIVLRAMTDFPGRADGKRDDQEYRITRDNFAKKMLYSWSNTLLNLYDFKLTKIPGGYWFKGSTRESHGLTSVVGTISVR